MKLNLVFIFLIAVLGSVSSCNRYGFPLRPNNLYSGYEIVIPPYNQNSQKAINVAVIKIVESNYDTSLLSIMLMENDSSYLVDFDVKEPIRRSIKDGETVMVVTQDGNTTLIISKKDLTVLKHYGSYRLQSILARQAFISQMLS